MAARIEAAIFVLKAKLFGKYPYGDGNIMIAQTGFFYTGRFFRFRFSMRNNKSNHILKSAIKS